METKEIPGNLLRKWEISATKQNLSQQEFVEYIRNKQREYYDVQEMTTVKKEMIDGQLTEYGKQKALEHFRKMDERKRAITLSRIDFEVYYNKIISNGYEENTCYEIISSYNILTERRERLSLTKKEMKMHGLILSKVNKMYEEAKRITGM